MADIFDNATTAGDDSMFFAGYKSLFYVARVVIACGSLVLSCMLFWVVYKENAFHKAGYLMLVSASVSQLCANVWASCIGALLVAVHRFHPLPSLAGRNPLTQMIVFFTDAGYFSALTALVVICVQRLVAVYFYSWYQRLVTMRTAAACVVVTWVVGVGIALPCHSGPLCLLHYDFVEKLSWSADWSHPLAITYTNIYLWFPMPSIGFMVIVYAMIGYRLRRQQLAVGGDGEAGTGAESESRRDESHICLQFMLISALYAAPPIEFFLVTHLVDVRSLTLAEAEALNVCESMLWTINFSIDPLVHLAMNKRLRRAFGRTFKLQRSENDMVM